MWEGMWGANPAPSSPVPASPSCDVSAWSLRSPFRSAALTPKTQGSGPQPALAAHEVPGRACNAAAVAGTWGQGEEGGLREKGREEASGTLASSPRSEGLGLSCWLGPPGWLLFSPSWEEDLQGCGAQGGGWGDKW